ncbi:MAG: hypothetical protein HY865_20835 [Chloroflexi bacterium]|nr:hypothetical protein [Chloroflexota bacterium]
MMSGIDEIESFLFLYLAGEFSIRDFEQWIYSTPQAEDRLGKSAYFELVSFNFYQPTADHELSKLIRKYVNPARFHTWQVWRSLKSLLDGTGDPVAAFIALHKMSCDGYDFLDNIRVQYLLGVEDIPTLTQKHLWDEKVFLSLRNKLDGHIQPLKNEIEMLLNALELGEIEIIGEGEYSIKPELSQQLKRISGEQENGGQPVSTKRDVKMGTYNTLQTSITCPHCKTLVDVEIEMRFGSTLRMEKFVIGDYYRWVSGKPVQHGGRPEKGNLEGEGYAECTHCRRDFFVKVTIREDRIESVEPDTEKAAYIQEGNVASTLLTPESTELPSTPSGWKLKPEVHGTGIITYNEKWVLTPKIRDLLEKLVKFGVDIFSTIDGDDYTLLAPHGLSREQQDEVDRLMNKLAKEVRGKLKYVDWYPHGWKFRIYPKSR